MFDLARRADDRALAVALDRLGVAAERGDQRFGHVEAERLQVVGEADDLLDIAAGERVPDDGEDRGAAIGGSRHRAAFVEDLLDHGDALAKFNRRHGAPLLHCELAAGTPSRRQRLRRRQQAGPFAEAQRGRLDEASAAPKLSLGRAGGKRALDFVRRQRPDGDSDQPLAEIALRVEIAGRRAPIAGWPGRSTALATSVAAASARAADAARTVTASAMPSEKLRPRQPDVATPRTRSRRADRCAAEQARPVRAIDHADRERFAGTKMKRDVAAVIDIGAGEPRGRPSSPRGPLRPPRRRPRPSA